MVKKEKIEDTIHLRAIKYGTDFPNGFKYGDIEKHYSRRISEWEIVRQYLSEAWNNKSNDTYRVTPFVLLKYGGNGRFDTA